jgi:Uma2 family endonuclease
MAAVSIKSPATIDDLRRSPKDGRTYELVDGVIVVSPAGMRHSIVAARITAVLGNFVFPRGIGEVCTEGVGIELPTGNVRSPDVSYVRRDNLPDGRAPVDDTEGDVLTAEPVLPGFSCRVSDFFPR